MAENLSPALYYQVNGRFNPLGGDGYYPEDLYDDATFYSPGDNLSYDNDPSDSTGGGYDKSVYEVHSPCGGGRQDGADVPLLNGLEGFGHPPPRLDASDFCKEPLPVTNSSAWKKLLMATTMCLVFMVVELVGGYVAGSLAVMTDAAHLLSDCVGFLVSLFAVWVAGQPPTKRFTFGYHRAEVLGALLSISVIWVLTGVFVYLAVTRLVRSDFDIHADAMLIVSAIGIGINIVMGCILHGGGFSHGHGHDGCGGRQEENINVRAAVVHVLGDLIQSVGVFISACVIKFYPSAKVIDPMCTFVCCVLVVVSTASVLRQSVWVLLETVPPHLDTERLSEALAALDSVDGVHSLHLWALTPGQYVCTAHISVGPLTDRDAVLERAQRLLRTEFSLERVTLQVERHAADVLAQ